MKTIQLCSLIATLACGACLMNGCETAPTSDGDRHALSTSVTAAMADFSNADPTLKELIGKSAGYAIFPSVGKAGFVVGGSYGRGEVYEKGAKVGYADIKQGTFGLQIGAQTFSELVIFMRDADVAKFKGGEFSLSANASAVALKPGVAASTDTSKGVIVFTRVSGGLMAEATVGGQVFKYLPM